MVILVFETHLSNPKLALSMASKWGSESPGLEPSHWTVAFGGAHHHPQVNSTSFMFARIHLSVSSSQWTMEIIKYYCSVLFNTEDEPSSS